MPRRDIDSELDAHRAFVAHTRDELGLSTAQEAYDNCWKLREWRDRLQEPGNRNATMLDFARYVLDSIEVGTWENDWTGIFLRMMGRDIPPTLRQQLIENMPLIQVARVICMGNGSRCFSLQELRNWKPQLDGIYYAHSGRHFIDEIPDG